MERRASRVLFLTTAGEDYLQDQLLYGLRRRLGERCVDWPRKDVMYASCPVPKAELYGRGFTLWKLLPDLDIDRETIVRQLREGRVGGGDLLVFGSIARQGAQLREWGRTVSDLGRGRVALVDGEDGTALRPLALAKGLYFKRERTRLTARLTLPISFSIPECKVVERVEPRKTRLFATHVQCEAAYGHPWVRAHCRRDYPFEEEAEYRSDLADSHFAVTARKNGWDCMRHYEIAASGCVPCFWRLGRKSDRGAPFGLVDGSNCVAFRSADELERKTRELLDSDGYGRVAEGALEWARAHTCERAADGLIGRLTGAGVTACASSSSIR